MIGGPVVPIQATFLSRSGGMIEENDDVPVPTAINFSSDVRQFSGAFDFEIELGEGESFDVQSHDFVEFYFMPPGGGQKFQIGAGFVEDFLATDTPAGETITANGREFSGQLIQIPFRKQIQAGGISYEQFLRNGISQGYIPKYASFRSLPDVLSSVNRYAGAMTVVTQQTMMVGALIQQYADLAINIAYQNRLGQLEVYGRGTDASSLVIPPAMGTLCHGFGQTNVTDVSVRQNFSRVYSECTVFWTANQASMDSGNPVLNSQRVTNADPRVAQLYQPLMKVFSADDLANLSGGISADQRIHQVALSEIRKSMQHVNEVTVTTPYPYYTPSQGPVIPFELQQIWRVRSQRRNIDQIMRLVGLHYKQDASSLEVQLQFVEPDTLI